MVPSEPDWQDIRRGLQAVAVEDKQSPDATCRNGRSTYTAGVGTHDGGIRLGAVVCKVLGRTTAVPQHPDTA